MDDKTPKLSYYLAEAYLYQPQVHYISLQEPRLLDAMPRRK